MQDELPPERFWFELGYGAAWADAFIANGQNPAWKMTDAAVDRAWDILPDCYDGDARDLERNALDTRTPDPALAAAQAEVAVLKGLLSEIVPSKLIGESHNPYPTGKTTILMSWNWLKRCRAALVTP